jgi:hypothetical protein
MAWTAKVILDADKNFVGQAIATWNAGLADEFEYSRRCEVNAADGQAFAAEAKAAKAARDARAARQTALANTLTGWLNA